MGHTAKAQRPPATETHAAPLANGSRRHPPACVGTALIDRRSRVRPARSRAASWRADIPEVSTFIPGAEPDVRMALKIETWQCSVGVAAFEDAGWLGLAVGLGSPVPDDSSSGAEFSGRLGHEAYGEAGYDRFAG
jgi:hypothetical protein